MLKVVKSAPPNYETVIAALNPQGTMFFCYGDTVYSPSGADVPEDILYHEAVHSKRQGESPDAWWNEYLVNPTFRLKEELIAYAEQYNFVKKHLGGKAATHCLEEIGHSLISSYNFNMTHGEAISKVRNTARAL